MLIHDSTYLIERLLTNALSRAELDTFLLGLHDPAQAQVYSDALAAHFDKLLSEPVTHPTPDGFAEQPDKPPASAKEERHKTKEAEQ